MITGIKIPSTWAQMHPSGSSASNRDAIAEFNLGLGCCGKVVDKLDFTADNPAFFAVIQCCGEEVKTFIYPYHTITGRIEIIENIS